jgi:hypothetical protein
MCGHVCLCTFTLKLLISSYKYYSIINETQGHLMYSHILLGLLNILCTYTPISVLVYS